MLICEECGNRVKIPVPGVNVIEDRGYYWCARCAKFDFVDGVPVVRFPGNGKMIPDTIMTGDN